MSKVNSYALTFLFLFQAFAGAGQNTRRICGQVNDEKGRPLPLAYVTLQSPEKMAVTDLDGKFCIRDLAPGIYHLHISFLGYNCIHDCQADVSEGDAWIDLTMYPESKHLSGVEISAQALPREPALTGLPTESAQRAELMQHKQGSLVKSLEYIPGLKAMEIG